MDTQISVEDMKAQVARIRELRETESKVNEMKKEVSSLLEIEEGKMLSMLEQSGLPNFKCDFGSVGVTHRLSVKTPKTPEDRAAFFSFLKQLGLFDSMITVNSQTLNSFYKDQFEQAKAQGKDDFKIPGINEETMTAILSFRKA
jgi:hypothetical protein